MESLLMPFVIDDLDPLQFAYVMNRSTEDASCPFMHKVCQHLDRKSSNTAQALFIDYSSAFNTIHHLLINKLEALGVPSYLQLWILDYLTNRPQYVRTNSETSSLITLNTGAPQGCVMSPLLFVLYTNDLCWNAPNVSLIKYADDTVVIGLIENDNATEYVDCIKLVNSWCKDNYLDLNINKTKEIIWDFRKNKTEKDSIVFYNFKELQVINTWDFYWMKISDIKSI
jgi:hypothetical protein